MSMNVSAVKYWLLSLVVLAAAYGSFVAWRGMHGPAASTARTAPRKTTSASANLPTGGPVTAFELTDGRGQKFDSASLRGKIWVGSFFFTNCPAICWRMNQALAAWQQTHPQSDVRFVSITCDPENDTPEALARYAAHFKADPARWTFLTGPFDEIKRIGNESFQVAVEKETHSDRAFVVDRQGTVRGRFRLTEPDQLELLTRLLDALAAEQAAEPGTEPGEAPPTSSGEPPGGPGTKATAAAATES
jgi:cytochrome oxidase Cu insertion factor (SCO1/SenC/PrrC family)